MTDKKLTDSEIVKALKEILEIMLVMGDLQKSSTISKALDLINRLQAENEEYKADKEQYIKDYEELETKLEYAKTETEFEKQRVEYLQTENESLYETLDFRFNKILELEDKLKTAKAEAYKECIEKVKEEIKQALENNYKVRAERIDKHNVGDKTDFISYCTGKIDCLRGIDDFLDNLLKELVGEDK